jgi:ParB-like chromosome segregation protein Spo0J
MPVSIVYTSVSELSPHPAALLIPMFIEDEQALAKDIREHGISHPLDITSQGKILDGVHRWQFAKEQGIRTVPAIVYSYENVIEEHLHALRVNVHRRQLTSSQKAILALELEKVFAEEAKKRVGGRPAARSEKLTQKFEEVSQGEAAEQAAKIIGSNRQYVYDAKKIVEQAPELKTPILQGLLTIPQAKELAAKPIAKREQILTYMLTGQKSGDFYALSESNEWYTPSVYIEAVRTLFGEIDVDPASNAYANKIVQAKTYFDKAVNGLTKQWHGKIFLNPPYGREEDATVATWVAYMLSQYKQGYTKEAVLLVNAGTDRSWFQPLWNYLLCFTHHRIHFYNQQGSSNQPTHGNVFVYLGKQQDHFISLFRQFGTIVAKVS